MENRIPLPTDNIFKFYALFGLLIVIFGFGSILYVGKTTNDLVFQVGVEYETLKADPVRSVSQEARFNLIQKRIEVAVKDKKAFFIILGMIIGLGTCMVWYGFRKWHTEIQPIQDEMSRLSLEKLKQEVAQGKSKSE